MIRINQIKVNALYNTKDNIINSICKKLKIKKENIKKINIYKQSLDARDKNNIMFVYEVDAIVDNEKDILKKHKDIFLSPNTTYQFQKNGNIKLTHNPVIIGSGPAGLFCAYFLALNGYNPIIIERGEKVEDRVKTVNVFWKENKLNVNSNVSFGEGGAGTFSDGKLNTLVKDKKNMIKKVYELFVKFGANEDIMYSYKPHIGTDVLVNIVKNMRNEIIRLGGKFHYNSCLTNLNIENNHIKSIIINNQYKIDCNVLILAIGHSARDTYKMLYDSKLNMESKPFAIGVRVEHSQDMINESQYGLIYKDVLPNAPYKLTYKSSNKRGVYSFCMCPGGYVVNASYSNGCLAINGMSYSDRNSKNANSAIVVTVTQEDFGLNPLDAIKYQIELEKKAYNLGNGKIPIQLLKDFKNNTISKSFDGLNPKIKGSYTFSNLNEIFPESILFSLKESFKYFGTKIKGFDNDNTILSAIETRTSSPVRITRDENFESNIKGIYPCGEGAGYAGGIISSAMDGIRVAEKIACKYK